MAILKTVTSMIVYTPLVLVCLTVLYGIGYGVWFYRNNDRLPPTYQYAGQTFLYVLKQIIKPFIALGQLLWWLVPLFPARFRDVYGWGPPWGAWADTNIARTIGILALISVITITSLVLKNGYPNTIIGYSTFLNGTLITTLIIAVLVVFVSFNRTIMTTGLANDPWPIGGVGDLPERQRKWVSKTAGTYLYYSIAVGLILGLLFTLFHLIVNYKSCVFYFVAHSK